MEQSSIYLYCLARAGSVGDLAVLGLDGGGPVASLEIRDLAAVISEVPMREFEQASPAGDPQDPAWVVAHAFRHEQVIETVMARSPVMPVRFGALFSSCDALKEFLDVHYVPIVDFLDWVADKEEWSAKVFVNVRAASEWAISSDLALAEQQRCLPSAQGTRYFLEKRLKTAARRQANLSSYAAAEEIHWAIVARAIEVVRLPLRPEPNAGNELLLNTALLVQCPDVADLRRLTVELESRFSEQGISMEWRGPWPPFHFCPSLDRTLA